MIQRRTIRGLITGLYRVILSFKRLLVGVGINHDPGGRCADRTQQTSGSVSSWHALRGLLTHSFAYRLAKRVQAAKLLALWTPRDQHRLDFYAGFIPRNSLCFDIGANIGNRTKILLALEARVVAVEPQPECTRFLETLRRRHPRLTIVPAVLGDREGEAELMVSNAPTISSLSPEWVQAVQSSGRFAGYTWDCKQMVSMTTLDRLIEKYGRPTFIKIDVEGYEYQVIRGLSQCVPMLSFEFTAPEFLTPALQSIEYLSQLGEIRLNYALGEETNWVLKEWILPAEMQQILNRMKGLPGVCGDVYVRIADGSTAACEA